MFKSARWRSEKNKVKFVFKLQFHAAKVPQIGDDPLMISIVPADIGKPTVKSDKAFVRDGSCYWDNPTYESVKFNRDPKSGKIHERIYYFVLGTGSSKSGVIGEASIDFSNYAETSKVSVVSLPLKCSNTEAVLNVSIQRMQDTVDYSEEKNESTKSDYKEQSSKEQLDNDDGTIKSNSGDLPFNKTVFNIAEPNGTRRASSGSDITMLSSESDNVHHEWLRNSPLEAASTYDSVRTLREEGFLGQHLSEESPNVIIEKLKLEVAALARRAEMSELELQTLRKQIVKESKKGQDLSKELVCLKEERDGLKGEFEKIKTAKTKTDLQFQGGGDCWEIVQELRQELNHVKEINANLQIQLQKTQESNSELILAVRDLDEMLETKKEILELPNGLLPKDVDEENVIEVGSTYKEDNDDDEEEQKALEELVKEYGDDKEAYLFEQQIIDLRGEIEIYKRDKDELEMQMEQLALDYEIMKQENHEMAYKLEQSELQEQLKMQYECSSSYNTVQELETHIENLENELKKRSKESENASVKINDLQDNVKNLEEELEKQSQDFEADLEALMGFKIEQEQRAIRAEEALRKTKWRNANTAQRLQDEFKKLYAQMTFTFEFNEKLAAKAVAEANELHLQKSRLEEIIKTASEEQKLVKGRYETRLHQLSDQVRLMTNQIEKMRQEIEEKELRLENQKKLEIEFDMCMEKNRILSDEIGNKETLMAELEKMRISIKEMELLSEQSKNEKIELEKMIMLAKSDAEEYHNELKKMRCIMEEKEFLVEKVQSELESLQLQCTRTLSEGELEKGILRKQLRLLKDDLKKRDDELSVMEKKILHGSEEGANFKERNMFREVTALTDNQAPKFRSTEETRNPDDDITNLKTCPAISLISDDKIQPAGLKCNVYNHGHHDYEITNEMTRLKERNKVMEAELNEMQERYSEISVKFAEVEGERQRLIMKVRNLKNAKSTS